LALPTLDHILLDREGDLLPLLIREIRQAVTAGRKPSSGSPDLHVVLPDGKTFVLTVFDLMRPCALRFRHIKYESRILFV